MEDATTTTTMTPVLASPPFHNIPGIHNFRDVGGYASTIQSTSSSPKLVRRGLVFRCADTSRVTDDGIAELNRLGIRKVFDLRSEPEVSKPGKVKEWEGAERIFLPVFLHQDYSPEAIALRWRHYASEGSEGFVQAYTAILNSSTSPTHPHAPLRTLLNHLTTNTTSSSGTEPPLPSPFLLHCTAGKDRTGVLIAIILSLVGIPDKTIAEEYSLTDSGLGPLRDALVKKLLEDSPLKGDVKGVERMSSSKREHMLGFLSAVRKEYGSVEDMVRELLDFGSEDVDRLRRILLVDDE